MKKSKNLKLIKKEDFGNSEYIKYLNETHTIEHHFTLKQKDGFVIKGQIIKIENETNSGPTYSVWTLKGSTIPFHSYNFHSYDHLIDFYSTWADDIKNDTLITKAKNFPWDKSVNID